MLVMVLSFSVVKIYSWDFKKKIVVVKEGFFLMVKIYIFGVDRSSEFTVFLDLAMYRRIIVSLVLLPCYIVHND